MKKKLLLLYFLMATFVANTQNIGIGTSSPAAKLQVAAGDASLALFGPNSYGAQLYIGATPINQTTASTAQVIASDGNLHIDPASGKNIYMGYFQARDIYLDPAGGNVGIGTTNPQKNLSVQNGMNVDQADGNTGSVVNAISFGYNSGEGIGSKRNAGGNQWGLDFYTGSANRMSITNSGNVGIGTTNPAAKLHISAGDASLALFGPNSFGGQLYIGATPYNQTTASTAQIIASDGNLHIDPASGKNIYVGYYQARDIYLNPTGGKVGIGTASPATTLEVNGYSKLGTDAPSIKVKKLTGTTAATQGGFVIIPHGLDYSKIISVTVLVFSGSGGIWVPPHFQTFSGIAFDWFSGFGGIRVDNIFSNSSNILSAPIKILITYEE